MTPVRYSCFCHSDLTALSDHLRAYGKKSQDGRCCHFKPLRNNAGFRARNISTILLHSRSATSKYYHFRTLKCCPFAQNRTASAFEVMTAHSMDHRLHLASLPRLLFDLFPWLQFVHDATLVLESSVVTVSVAGAERGSMARGITDSK